MGELAVNSYPDRLNQNEAGVLSKPKFKFMLHSHRKLQCSWYKTIENYFI